MRTAAAVLAGLAAVVATSFAKVGDAAPRPAARAPGLALTITPNAKGRAGSLDADSRVARLLALAVEQGAPPTPFVDRGSFRAEWRGFLDVPRRDDYVFRFQGLGSFELEIDGAVVLEARGSGDDWVESAPVRLKKGERALVARYRSPLSGAAAVRLTWRDRRSPDEPIDPRSLSHDPTDPALVEGAARRRGRMLFATRRCASCHAPGDLGAAAMPELAMRGPALDAIGARRRVDWLARWIRAPRAARAAARMPHVDLGPEPERTAADLAAFLAAGADGAAAAPDGADGAAAVGDPLAGAERFGALGCFACHGFDTAGDPATGATWISLAGVADRFAPAALAAFLREPAAHDPWIRMPHLRLATAEADDLAAYLLERAAAPRSDGAAAGDATRGAEAFTALGCASCHPLGGALAPPPAAARELAALADWTRGCVADDVTARGAAPDFGFDAADRAALRAFATALPLASLARTVPAEFAARQIEERGCVACHQLDDRTSWWVTREPLRAAMGIPVADPTAAGADEAGHPEVAQLRPALTWVGEKLQRSWLEGFVAGALPSPRPWLAARMPSLPTIAAPLAAGLAAMHGVGGDDPAPAVDRVIAATGAGLIEAQGGFGCVTCHAVGPRMPAALFEVQGINLADVAARLRPEYYRRWMLDPERLEPAAKMPRYADENGRTGLPACGGDARAQFDAIWQFLHGGELR